MNRDPVARGLVTPCIDAVEAARDGLTHERAVLAVRFATALHEHGWRKHQHRCSISRTEPGSTPLMGPLDEATARALQRCQDLADQIADSLPPNPGPTVPFAAWPRGADGRTFRLRWASDARPNEWSPTHTGSLADDKQAIIWQSVIVEVASSWARIDQRGRSAGRVFLGPKDRFLFWPKALNALLLHASAPVGRLIDLFAILAAAGVKLDIAAAYRALELDPEDAIFHAALIDGIWVIFQRLSFGMAHSPAIFATALATTLNRFRGSFPATEAALAQWVDDSALSGTRPATAVFAAEALMTALVRDRWWIAIPKTWLYPAVRLLYTGFIADFPARTIRIWRQKLDKLIAKLRSVRRPTDAAIAAAAPHQPESSQPTTDVCASRRSRLSLLVNNSPSSFHHVAMGPLIPSDAAPSPSRRIHHFRGAGDADLPLEFQVRATDSYGSATEGASRLASRVAAACLDDAALVVTAPDADIAHQLRAAIPNTPATTVVIVTPALTPAATTAGSELRWWDPAHRLPQRFRSRRVNPDALPAAASIDLPLQDGDRLELDPEEFHAVQSAVGLLSWFQVALPFLAVWRAGLGILARVAAWTAYTAAAFDAVFALAAVLDEWECVVDPPSNTLYVRTDASGTGWGATVTLPDSTILYLAGALDPSTAIAASGVREAAAAVAAIRAALAHPACPVFDAVWVTVDSTNLCGAASGHPRAAALIAVLAPLAAWAAQGLHVRFEWETRSAAAHAAPDALSSAASRVAPWPLSHTVHQALRADVPWTVAAWSYRGNDTPNLAPADAYATPASSDLAPERHAILQGLTTMQASAPAGARTGWIGMSEAIRLRHDEVAFVHPMWSDLGTVIAWQAATDCSAIVIAPRPTDRARMQYWAPYVERLASTCIAYADLPEHATVPPIPGATRDPYPLRAYVLGARAPDPVGNQRGSSLGTPSRLAWVRGGRNPGDGPLEDAFVTPPRRDRDTTRFRAARRRPSREPVRATATDPAATEFPAPQRQPATSLAAMLCTPPPPDQRASVLRPVGPAPPGIRSSGETRRRPPERSSSPAPKRRDTADGATAATVSTLARPGWLRATQPRTFRDWFICLRDFIQGESSGVIDASVPAALRADVAAARGVIRLKAIAGSRRPATALRQLYTMAAALPGVLASSFCEASLDALATAFARRRLLKPPPFGWRPAKQASCPQSALSAVAALSRKAGIHAPPVCGRTAAAYLDARGANGRREHSEAWPVHLHELLASEPTGPHPPTGPSTLWWTWAALVLMSFLCLRTGILRHICREMLVPYDNGYVFCWRWITKTSSADILDPELRSAVTRVSAARHPTLTRIVQACGPKGPMFPAAAVADDALSGFVRNMVGDVPDNFRIGSYGVRIAADCEAVELGVPSDVIDALFWWRRMVTATRAYYSGLCIRMMFLFSEHRTRLRFAHVAPGSYDARIVGPPAPAFTTVALGQGAPMPSLPPQTVADLNAAWGAEPSSVPSARMAVARANVAAAAAIADTHPHPQPDPAPVFPDPSPDDEDDDGDLSGDCDGCGQHMDRNTTGTMCEDRACDRMRCRTCHPRRVIWRCTAHPSARVTTTRKKIP